MSIPGIQDYGLKCSSPPAVSKTLRYEAPINLTGPNQFAGDCEVGAFSYINPHGSFSNTSIGRFCSIAEWVCTGPGQHHTGFFSTHPFTYDPEDGTAVLSQFPAYRAILGRTPISKPDEPSRTASSERVTIGNDVWIGTRVIIVNGVTVGDGAVIGAGSIVTKNVAPYSIVAGVPARVIRARFASAIVEQLLALRWWEFDMSAVSNQVDYGKVEAVIAFMNDRRTAGKLAKFSPKRTS